LLAAVVAQPDVERLWAALQADPTIQVTVDLESRTVSWPGESAPFVIDDYTRWRLLEGLDDVDLTLRHADEISEFEKSRPNWQPTTI
jgi:3-isopropylmalate/(R)-2-methylmalate dehydratase small subunit